MTLIHNWRQQVKWTVGLLTVFSTIGAFTLAIMWHPYWWVALAVWVPTVFVWKMWAQEL